MSQSAEEVYKAPSRSDSSLVQWVKAQWFKRKGKGFGSQLSCFQVNVICIQSLPLHVMPMLACLVDTFFSTSTQPRKSKFVHFLGIYP